MLLLDEWTLEDPVVELVLGQEVPQSDGVLLHDTSVDLVWLHGEVLLEARRL